MASLTPKQINLSQINGGNEYVNGNGVQPNLFNDCAEGVAYCDEQRQALIQTPDNSEANNVGIPTVSFVDTTVNGRTYKKLKFANLKGATGETGAKGDTGVGVPTGGTTGQVLKKKSNTDYDTEWANESGGSSGSGTGSNSNLLINSNFAINQRGNTSYTGAVYGFDRWSGGSTKSKIEQTTNGVKIYTTSSVTSDAVVAMQKIEQSFDNYVGQSFTASVNVKSLVGSNIRLFIRFGKNDGSYLSTTALPITSNGIKQKTFTIPASCSSIWFEFVAGNGAITNDYIEIEWAKLEIGDTATTYTPPLIAEELPKCQRYYEKIKTVGGSSNTIANGAKRSNTSHRFFLCVTPKRVAPTIKNSGVEILNYATGLVTVIADNSLSLLSNSGYNIALNYTKEITDGAIGTNVALLGVTASGYVEIDAEL